MYMVYTYVGTNKYRFEIINIQRRLAPLQSVISVEVKLFGTKGKESGLLRCAQLPCTHSFYEIETIQFKECYIDVLAYANDLEEFLTYLTILIPEEIEIYEF